MTARVEVVKNLIDEKAACSFNEFYVYIRRCDGMRPFVVTKDWNNVS